MPAFASPTWIFTTSGSKSEKKSTLRGVVVRKSEVCQAMSVLVWKCDLNWQSHPLTAFRLKCQKYFKTNSPLSKAVPTQNPGPMCKYYTKNCRHMGEYSLESQIREESWCCKKTY